MSKADVSGQVGIVHEIEANLWETWTNFGCGEGCSVHDEDDLLWVEAPIPIVPYNGVLRAHLHADADQRIDSIVDHFAARNVQFMWIVHPSSTPSDLNDRLRGRGLTDVEPMYGMARGLDDLPEVPPVPDGVEIRKVTDEGDAVAFHQFAAWRWHVADEYREQHAAVLKPFRLGQSGSKAHVWQAWLGGQPVAKAVTYLAARSAGIYGVATRPEARRLGLASALTLTALHAAHAWGYRLAVLHSTPMAQGLYRSLGFAAHAEFRLFASAEVSV